MNNDECLLCVIDETQDFDMIMLKMLLNDTTIPKIFVGDQDNLFMILEDVLMPSIIYRKKHLL